MPLPAPLKFSSVFTTAENSELFLLTCQGHQTKSFLSRHLGEISSEGKIAIMLVSGGAATSWWYLLKLTDGRASLSQ